MFQVLLSQLAIDKCEKSDITYYAGLLKNTPIVLEMISLVKVGRLRMVLPCGGFSSRSSHLHLISTRIFSDQ